MFRRMVDEYGPWISWIRPTFQTFVRELFPNNLVHAERKAADLSSPNQSLGLNECR